MSYAQTLQNKFQQRTSDYWSSQKLTCQPQMECHRAAVFALVRSQEMNGFLTTRYFVFILLLNCCDHCSPLNLNLS